ncbi:MAG: N-6 DNA methylase [Acidobacteria bacterium]|nr:N-6 DNA methylase [Acidobacteriota bacterium]
MATDYVIADHQAWLGYLQPDGLVVSPAALSDAQVIVDRHAGPLQRHFLGFVEGVENSHGERVAQIRNLREFLLGFLDWPEDALVSAADGALPESLSVPLPEFGETLSPDFALRSLGQPGEATTWLLLIRVLEPDVDLDERTTPLESRWSASPAQRFERLLRDTRTPIGLITNHRVVRLVYAPRGENAGSLTFPVEAMGEVAGRLIVSAFHTLLGRFSLFNAPTEARLPAVLARSREYQARVSSELAAQVLDALYELVRGFQSADAKAHGALLAEALAQDPDRIYRGLLNTLMRLVFLLFAEDRGLMPLTGLYQRNYAVHGLFERLRSDAERYPDTMDQRYGAWAQLLALFRAVHSGCYQSQMRMPARSGYLFDPARFPFLEGRDPTTGEAVPPLVSDGVVFRVLRKLLVLDGERLSYRTLDVEQIGSVYETMMGFRLEQVTALTIALKPSKAHGAPAVVRLADLLAVTPKDRAKWLKEHADHTLPATAAKEVEAARTADALLAALNRRIARNATPAPVAPGGLVLQPSDARRRSGSHYTPRSLTEPIVRTTLAPILARLGDRPAPAEILDLKVCDPAVGSGAFLVEACRQLADHLVTAWHVHGEAPTIPPDEDEVLMARRLVAQRCLYGVDRNPMAVDLAKLSLWLATLARDHPFTFLDHAIRSGDSLVGLTRRQIEDLDWAPRQNRTLTFGQDELLRRLNAATSRRREILTAGDFMLPDEKAQRLRAADESLERVREAGDLVIAAFFAATKDRARRLELERVRDLAGAQFSRTSSSTIPVEVWQRLEADRAALRGGDLPVTPFHWPIEFPEVFAGEAGGFDAIVGNPPFAGKNTLINSNREGYLPWLQTLHPGAHGNADLVAHFFRRAYGLLRHDGCLGLIATNTIAQGDTRSSGLTAIVREGGTIYAATKRLKWPGQAAVIVSVVHIVKGSNPGPYRLDGRWVEQITSFLFHAGGNDDPLPLIPNEGRSFQGSIVLGMGFTFDDTDKKGAANSLADMQRLIVADPRNAERILPYIGGEEVNDSPTHAHHRYVINFADFPLRREPRPEGDWALAEPAQRRAWLQSGVVPPDYPQPVAADWPQLLEVVERRVKPERSKDKRPLYRNAWWRHAERRTRLWAALEGRASVLVTSRVSGHLAFTRLPAGMVYSERLVVIPENHEEHFAVLHSRVHEIWARFFGSSLKDDLMYAPSDCFESFPFPLGSSASLEYVAAAGTAYLAARTQTMAQRQEGLTDTYNRFHNRDEHADDVRHLRGLHAALDRAVLDAYGWIDIPTHCEFILDYEEDDESSRRRRPWRYRWPNDIRDEVLARLLQLNQERAREEELAGLRDRTGRGRRRDTDGDDDPED